MIARRSKLRPIPPAPPRPRRVDGPGWFLDTPGREPEPEPVPLAEVAWLIRRNLLIGVLLLGAFALGAGVQFVGCHRPPPRGPLVPVNRSPVPADRPEPPLILDGREVAP